jgi:hypothetical protein
MVSMLLLACSSRSPATTAFGPAPTSPGISSSAESLNDVVVDQAYNQIHDVPGLDQFNLQRDQFSYIGRVVFGQTEVTLISLDGARLTGVSLRDMQSFYEQAARFASGRQVIAVTMWGTSFGESLSPLYYRMTLSPYTSHFVLITNDFKYAEAVPSSLLGASDAATTPLATGTLSVITNVTNGSLPNQVAAATEACQGTLWTQILSRSAARIKAAVKAAGRNVASDLKALATYYYDVGQETVCNGIGYAEGYRLAHFRWADYSFQMQGQFVAEQGLTWSWGLSRSAYNSLPQS